MSKPPSSIRYSATTGGFYHAGLHAGAIPDDAIPITERRHRELLAGQGTGRAIVASTSGAPELAAAPRLTVARQREIALRAIKNEARSRILAVATIERQTNDNAVIAMRGLATPTDQPTDAELAAITAAIARRRRIDAIRAASNTLEATIANWSAAALAKFKADDAAHWPKDQA